MPDEIPDRLVKDFLDLNLFEKYNDEKKRKEKFSLRILMNKRISNSSIFKLNSEFLTNELEPSDIQYFRLVVSADQDTIVI